MKPVCNLELQLPGLVISFLLSGFEQQKEKTQWSASDESAYWQISEKMILRKNVLLSEPIKRHHSAIRHQVAHRLYTPARARGEGGVRQTGGQV